jgi:hypothetical protein
VAVRVRCSVAEAITAGQSSFERQYGPMADSARVTTLAAVENSYDVMKYEQSLTDCPACGAYPVVSYFPGYLHCRACDLELDGEEQLEAAEIERSWKIEDADAADFYEEDYE